MTGANLSNGTKDSAAKCGVASRTGIIFVCVFQASAEREGKGAPPVARDSRSALAFALVSAHLKNAKQ